MNLTAEIHRAQRSLGFYLEHYADSHASRDAIGQRNARLGIRRCLHVIRLAKSLSPSPPDHQPVSQP